jgi:hypothetical protein
MPGFRVCHSAKTEQNLCRIFLIMGCLAFADPVKQCSYTIMAAIKNFLAD